MESDIAVEWKGETPIMHLSGDLNGDGGSALEELYGQLPPSARRRVLLECEQLRYVNSSGIAGLLSIITSAVEFGHRVDFCGVPVQLRRVMNLAGMVDYVRSYDTLEEALDDA